jgi:hypothetical protein
MTYAQRFLFGLVLMLASFLILWWGSPLRTGAGRPELLYALAFNFVFALGFILAATAALGMKADYPGFLSGVVLYFMVGALVSVMLYVSGTQVGPISLEDAAHSEFWMQWVRVTALWPLELVQRAELMDYHLLRMQSR